MSNENGTQPEQSEKITRAQYNAAVENLATGIYVNLAKAGFTKDTLTDLALARKSDVEWPKLNTKIKLCLIRLAMSMMPVEPPEMEEKEDKSAKPSLRGEEEKPEGKSEEAAHEEQV